MSLQSLLIACLCCPLWLSMCGGPVSRADDRPNILFCFADDWGRYASIYQDPDRAGLCDLISTPALDAVGRSGVVFTHAFVSAPSCTPSRAAVVTGMPFYRCGSNAFLRCREYGKHPDPYRELPAFSELLIQNGYHAMHWGKTTNRSAKRVDRRHDAAINHFSQAASAAEDPQARKQEIFSFVRSNFRRFLDDRQDDQPFLYWFGPHNSHRQWTRGSGKAIWGLEPDSLQGKLPAFLPDVPAVREDIADYLGEALAWDGMVHELMEELKNRGELDNTLVIVSGDHGMPGMPRGKCNLHDFGAHVALLVSWPQRVPAGRRIDDFVSLMDIAPTVLEASGTQRPPQMLAGSLLGLLTSGGDGRIDAQRDHVIIGRERHVGESRRDRTPYPSRAIRTRDYLLIRNFKPQRMPMGDVFTSDASAADLLQNHYLAYPDMDASPTKTFLMTQRDTYPELFDVAFARRPEFELYDLQQDPDQMVNVATRSDYADVRRRLTTRLMDELRATQDPRVMGDGATFDRPPFVDASFVPPPKKKKTLKF